MKSGRTGKAHFEKWAPFGYRFLGLTVFLCVLGAFAMSQKKRKTQSLISMDSGSLIHSHRSAHQLKIQSNKEKWSAAGFVITGRESSASVMVTVSVAPEEGTIR